jgi:hypothetical protein
VAGQTRTYALAASRVYALGRSTSPEENQRDASVAKDLIAEWDGPRHRVTRALLGVHQGATYAQPSNTTDAMDDERVADGCRYINQCLCVLATARLDGTAHTVAAALAEHWAGSPAELLQTARGIAAA